MPPVDRQKIKDYFINSLLALTNADKGRLLEDLSCYLMESVPGVAIAERNKLNAFATEEIDVAVWNEQERQGGLYFLPFVILIECKNWSKPVGSQEVVYFANRLQHRGCDYGILVAAEGVTGNSEDLKSAKFEIAQALAKGQRILVVSRTDIESLTHTDDFVRLLKQKILELTVSGTVY